MQALMTWTAVAYTPTGRAACAESATLNTSAVLGAVALPAARVVGVSVLVFAKLNMDSRCTRSLGRVVKLDTII